MRLRLAPPSLPRDALRALRRGVVSAALVATTACSSADGSTAAPAGDADAAQAADGDTPGNAGDDVPTVDDTPHPGDPIASAAVGGAVEAPAGFASLARAGEASVTLAGTRVLRYADGADAGAEVLALDAPGVAVAATADAVFAVDRAGTWYRAAGADVVRVAGPVVQRLVVDDDTLVGVLGADGVAVAPLSLATAPVQVTSLGAVRAVASAGVQSRVVARDLGGFALVTGSWDAPTIVSTLPTKLPASAVTVSGSRVVGLEGGANLHTLSLEDDALVSVGRAPLKGPGLAVTLVADVALVADWDRVIAYDVSDMAAPTRVGSEPLGEQRALDVVTTGEQSAQLRTLAGLRTLTLDRLAQAPELALSPPRIQIEATAESNGGSAGILFRNNGPVALEVRDLAVNDARLHLDLPSEPGAGEPALVVEANDVAFLEIGVTGTAPLSAQLAFTTNEPGREAYAVPLVVNPKRLEVGDPAPDFLLPGTAGEQITLGELMGRVIHVKLFNAY